MALENFALQLFVGEDDLGDVLKPYKVKCHQDVLRPCTSEHVAASFLKKGFSERGPHGCDVHLQNIA